MTIYQRGYLVVLICLLTGGGIWSQTEPEDTAPESSQREQSVLPRTYRELSLGMGLDELKEALKKDELFRFRGDRDVSFLPVREQNLVETTGFSFVKRAFFQLQSGQVFVMAFTLNTNLVDYYSMFTSFVKKYGEPDFLDPKQAVWESEETRIAIERPLTVKYIDMQVFNALNNESKSVESKELRMREDFLNEF
ncbi:MAG: hypothetical protein LBD29_04080 [Treponema sp.]|jgi:hypothetical protein|nr:hypothetical protein [Treponema sp.]